MDTPERRDRLERSAERLLQLIRTEAPDELIARECITVFRHGLATFETTATDVLGRWLVRSIRGNIGQCADCGAELGKKSQGLPICSTCLNSGDLNYLKQELEHGPDSVDFNVDDIKPDS